MPAAAREYLSRKGIGELHACEQLLAAVTAAVRGTFDSQSSNRRANFFARIIVDEQESEDERITKDEVETHSKGVYPFLWLNFTYDPTRVRPHEILALELRFGLSLIGTAASDTDFY
ncbi:MAG: hypothetical protein H8E66_08205 [Planctomycetes bacterium]|nr:hypothetical protein [Planctomycetota bacterium]